jgi:2-haloacid dehalogenase
MKTLRTLNPVRRALVGGIATLGALGVGACARPVKTGSSQTQSGETVAGVDNVRAMVFDVFGTLVDWRTSVARESRQVLEPLGYKLDWLAFADAWRAEYQPGMEEVRSGRIPFSKLDVIHRRMLERIRPRFGLEKVDEPTLKHLNFAWHRLDAWPDVPASLARLRTRYLLGPCSNGNISLMVDLARRNNIHWDAILGAEIARDYKPKPGVYLAAAEALGLQPNEVMMVAAHSNDLEAAGKTGLRTAHVAQIHEYGPNTGEAKPTVSVDVFAPSFTEFARMMAP